MLRSIEARGLLSTTRNGGKTRIQVFYGAAGESLYPPTDSPVFGFWDLTGRWAAEQKYLFCL